MLSIILHWATNLFFAYLIYGNARRLAKRGVPTWKALPVLLLCVYGFFIADALSGFICVLIAVIWISHLADDDDGGDDEEEEEKVGEAEGGLTDVVRGSIQRDVEATA